MDHGRLTDSTVNQWISEMYSDYDNKCWCSEMTKQQIGFGRGQKLEAGTEAIEKAFTPEFRNRLDAVIPFTPLKQVVHIRLLINLLCSLSSAQ